MLCTGFIRKYVSLRDIEFQRRPRGDYLRQLVNSKHVFSKEVIFFKFCQNSDKTIDYIPNM